MVQSIAFWKTITTEMSHTGKGFQCSSYPHLYMSIGNYKIITVGCCSQKGDLSLREGPQDDNL